MDFGDTSKYRDRESALKAVLRYGYALKDVSTDLRDDEEVVRAAVMNKGYALGYASERLRNDKRTVMIAVNQSWWAIRCASVELRADDDVIAVGIAQSCEFSMMSVKAPPFHIKCSFAQTHLPARRASISRILSGGPAAEKIRSCDQTTSHCTRQRGEEPITAKASWTEKEQTRTE